MYYLEFIIPSSKNVTAKIGHGHNKIAFPAYEFVSASSTVVCDSSKQWCPLAGASMVSEKRH